MAKRSSVGKVAPNKTPPKEEFETDPIAALSMGDGYERIIERTFSVDVDAESSDLEEAMRVGDVVRGDYALLADALDNAEDNARRAHRVFCNAKVAFDAFEIDARIIESGLREEASEQLEEDRAKGIRKKAATKDDILARMYQEFGDEVRNLEHKRSSAKMTVEHMERIADLWKIRCRTLQTLVATAKH